VLSALGQPLHAEIELISVATDEVGTLAPKLASMEAFHQANIDFNPVLLSLRFAVDQRSGRQFIRVTSAQPINEPFVDMLLELGGTNGRLLREYSFLLDPTDLRSTQFAQVTSPAMLEPTPPVRQASNAAAELAPVSETEKASQQTAAKQDEPAPVSETEKAPQQIAAKQDEPAPISETEKVPEQIATKQDKPAPASDVEKASQQTAAKQDKPSSATQPSTPAKESVVINEYKVKSGDSLSRIARQVKLEGISLDQMLVALYRTNPEAFIDKNMNRLRAGHILSVPDADTAARVSKSEARKIVIAQAANFNNYRNKLAGQVVASETRKTSESEQSATGKITAKVEEHPTVANESKDKLKLSKAGAANAADKASGIVAGTEDKIAQEKALAEDSARTKELEKNVGDLQKILEIKNKSMADQQKQVAGANAASVPAAPDASADAALAASMTDAKADASMPAAVSDAASASAAASAPKVAAVQPKPSKVAPLPPEPSLLDDLLDNLLLDNPLLLPGLAALVVALGGLGFYNIRRRKQSKQFEDSIITDSSLKANSLFGSTGGQSVDTNNSVFNSSYAPSVGSLDSNEVDPVAEADVYIAYGRDAQAEEILKEALRTQPERHGVRVKLLEIYANRKDLRAFESLASELYALTKGKGEDWKQAVSLGAGIDPKNPLYAAGGTSGKATAPAMTAPTQPLEETNLDAFLTATPAFQPKSAAQLKKKSSEGEGKTLSNDLDFDLEGLGVDRIEAPNTIPLPMPIEPQADLEEINFDFLDEKIPATEPDPAPAPAPAMPAAKAATAKTSAVEPLALEMPAVEKVTAATAATNEPSRAAGKTEALEFDLSGITPNFGLEKAKPSLVHETYGVHDTGSDDYSNNTEMATKLDLAAAYKEIGDKEGARELLDEVAKGGSPEQAEKARSLLAKLG
ncbi:MAG TPA: FimV/HubP family polar landmark protein, partial [Burkholderiaceae bacterium]|nr:FimV/HubP family polar landmark protein [Burkholderiaceae bacterium]